MILTISYRNGPCLTLFLHKCISFHFIYLFNMIILMSVPVFSFQARGKEVNKNADDIDHMKQNMDKDERQLDNGR